MVFPPRFPADIPLLFRVQSFPHFPVGISGFSQLAFSSILRRRITAVFVPANSLKLPGCRVFFPVFPSFSLHFRTPAGRRNAVFAAGTAAVGKVPIFVSRQIGRYRAAAVRFPSNFFPPSPRAVVTVVVSSPRDPPRESASSVGTTGFPARIVRTTSARHAGVSTGRGTRGEEVTDRYFFDATSGRFSEVCLPSQLNHRRQRAKERENRQKLVVSEEAGAKLPSRVGLGDVWDVGGDETGVCATDAGEPARAAVHGDDDCLYHGGIVAWEVACLLHSLQIKGSICRMVMASIDSIDAITHKQHSLTPLRIATFPTNIVDEGYSVPSF